MHGHDWDGEPVIGWHLTEKLDGCRARWTGAELLSRGGHPIRNTPQHLLAALPAGLPLDIEVYAGPGRQDLTRRAVQYGQWAPEVQLIAFDAPAAPGGWLERMATIPATVARAPHLGNIASLHGLILALSYVQRRGGEGLMLHAPGAAYTPRRTFNLLKVKRGEVLCASQHATPTDQGALAA